MAGQPPSRRFTGFIQFLARFWNAQVLLLQNFIFLEFALAILF